MADEFRLEERPGWGPLATFVPNKGLPVYSWFYYKEGFSRELVTRLLKDMNHGWVLDPFCGVGTTMLACSEAGVDSVGFDVHPVSVFASRVKTRQYDAGRVRKAIDELFRAKYCRPRVTARLPIVRRAFPPRLLEQVMFFREQVMNVRDGALRDLLMLGLMDVAVKSSYLFKDGAVLKIRKKPVPPVRHLFKRQLWRMARDLETIRRSGKAIAEFGDARSIRLEDCSVSGIITSPPYLNKIEYTRIYEVEQELFLRHVMPERPVRTFMGLTLEKVEKCSAMLAGVLDQDTVNRLPQEACPYFVDMAQAICEMHRVCKPGSRVALVVGNGCFPDRVVDSDIILSRIARGAGFEVEKIVVLNRRWCTRNRTEKVGQLRESLLMWRKP